VRSNSPAALILDFAPPSPALLDPAEAGTALFVPSLGQVDREALAGAGYRLVTAADIVTATADGEAKRVAVEAMERLWRVRIDGARLGDALAYRGVRLADVAHAHLVTALADALARLAALDAWWSEETIGAVHVPREPGPWGRVAELLARAKGMPVGRLRGIPPRAPLWPPTARSMTQWAPDALRRWRDARDAHHADAALAERCAAQPPDMRQADILAIGHYISEARALVPIIRRLQAEGSASVAVVGDEWGRGPEAFRAARIEYVPLQSLDAWRDAAPRVAMAARTLGRLWQRALKTDEARAIAHRGVSIPALVREEWRVLGDLSLRHDCIREYLWWIEMIDRAMELASPRLVLLADEAMPVNVIQLELAEQRKIATLHVQHGALPEHPKHRTGRATCITVGGEALRRFFLQRGTDPRRVVVTGIPQFDPLADHAALAAVPIRRGLAIPDGRLVVVYTMQSGQGVTPRDEVVAATHEVLAANAAMRDRLTFVFKRHPGDRGDLLRRMGIDPAREGIIDTFDAPIHPLLWVADVVVTQMSTTGQEALMLGKPLVVVNLSGKPDSIPYVAYGAALGVYHAGDLSDAIERALADEATRARLAVGRQRFVEDFAYRVDGHATERIVKEVFALVHGDRTSGSGQCVGGGSGCAESAG